MKFFFFVVSLLFVTTAQGQFLKNLKKGLEKEIEKVTEEIGGNQSDSGSSSGSSSDSSSVSHTYTSYMDNEEWAVVLDFNHLDFVDPMDLRISNLRRIPDDKCLLFFHPEFGEKTSLGSSTFFLMFKGGLFCEVSLNPKNMVTKWYRFSGLFRRPTGHNLSQVGSQMEYEITKMDGLEFADGMYGFDSNFAWEAQQIIVYDMNSSDSPTLKTIFENRDRFLGAPSDEPFRMIADIKETLVSAYMESVYLSLSKKIEQKFGQPNDVKAFSNVNFGESKSVVKNKLSENSSLSLILEGQGNFPFLHHLYYKLKVANYNFILQLIFNEDRLGSLSILSDDEEKIVEKINSEVNLRHPSNGFRNGNAVTVQMTHWARDSKRESDETSFVGFSLLKNYKFKSFLGEIEKGEVVIDTTPPVNFGTISRWFRNPKRVMLGKHVSGEPTLFENIDLVHPSFSNGQLPEKFSIYKSPIDTRSYDYVELTGERTVLQDIEADLIERSKRGGFSWRFTLDYLPVNFSIQQRVYGEYANSRIEGFLEQLDESEKTSDLF